MFLINMVLLSVFLIELSQTYDDQQLGGKKVSKSFKVNIYSKYLSHFGDFLSI